MVALGVYLDRWRLKQPVEMLKTPTSHLYQVEHQGDQAVLKILTELGVRDEQAGAIALSCWNGDGAVRLRRYDRGAHLLEYLPGEPLGESPESAGTLLGVVTRLHSYRGPLPPELPTLRSHFRALWERRDQTFYRGPAWVAERLLETPRGSVLLHGDLHHANLLRRAEEWVAIDPKGVIGEATFDVCNWFYNPDCSAIDPDRIERLVNLFSQALGVEPVRVQQFVYAYGGLSLAWCEEDGEASAHRREVFRLLEALVLPFEDY